MALGAIATYITTIERRLGNRMTREEHDRHCNEKHQQLLSVMNRIEGKVDTNTRESGRQRDGMSRQLNSVAREVAVLRERSRNQQGLRDDEHDRDDDEERVG